jgi:hypothetical protein
VNEARRRTPIRIALVGAALLASVALTAQASATPHMKGAVRDPRILRSEVVRLFDQLDRVRGAIESVREDIERADRRISNVSRKIEALRELIGRRAAEAYMAGRAGGIESILGASTLTDFGDALEFIDAVSQDDEDLLLALQHAQAQIELERARLEALEEALRGRRDRLEAVARGLVEALHHQRALLRRADGGDASNGSTGSAPDLPPSPSSSPQGPAPGQEAVMALVRDLFASLGPGAVETALCVAERESGFDPLAVNPATEASGLFQFIPSTWDSLSRLAGWGGASVFDARANASVAAWTVAHYGWHPWRSVASGCGAA